MKTIALFFLMSALLVTNGFAAILVRGCNDQVMTFDTLPVATEWASASISGASGDITNSIQLDGRVQTNAATRITNVLGNSPSFFPSPNALAQWSAPGQYIQTSAGNNAATLLMATLESPFSHGPVDVFFDFGVQAAIPGEQLGVRTYFSTNGAPNSWQFITELSNATSVAWSLHPGFSVGGVLYLLFADDNGSSTDIGFTIDNFGAVASGDPFPITIINQPQSTNVAERGNATFSVQASGAPQCFSWFRNGNAIPGAHGNSYTLTNASYSLDNGAQFRVAVSNVVYFAVSSIATLTVVPDTTPPIALRGVGELALDEVTIWFSEALNPETVNEANFILYESGTDPFDSPYRTFAATLKDGTNVTLKTDNRLVFGDYAVAILDVQDNSSQLNPIDPNPTTLRLRQIIQLIGFDTDNEWKYDINHGDRSGTGWEKMEFDDSDWPSGPAGLGLDVVENAVPIRTTLPYNRDSATAYFRKRFTSHGPGIETALRLRTVIDDGAVFFLNGQEILRQNVASGTLNSNTRATIGAAEPTPTAGPFYLPTTNLFLGENVLAVQLFQSGATSVDMEMAAELTAEFTSYCSCGLQVAVQPQSQAVIEGQNFTLSVQVHGAVPLTYQWYKNYSPVTNGTYPFLSILSANPNEDAGEYFVVVSNSLSVVTSQVAIIWMEGPLPPLFLSAQQGGNPTTISLSFSQNLAADAAQSASNYKVRVQDGEELLTIFSAVMANARNVILTTEPRRPCENYEITITNLTDNYSQLVKPYSRTLTPTVPLATPRRIEIRQQPTGEVMVEWWACRGTLQQATSLLNANTLWTNVPGNPTNYTILPNAGESRFFRVAR